MLRVAGVTFRYDGQRGVDDVTFEVAGGGSLIALAGPNGSGKSTLLKLLARVAAPQQGEVVFEERRDWPPKEYARRVAYLPQETDAAFPMRAIDVVVSGRAPYLSRFALESEADYEAARRALATCDALDLAERDLDEMSGGERKRVFLARALVGEPRLILLDEPFAALDLAHVQQFSMLLHQIALQGQAAVIFASHDLNWAAAYSSRMLVMERGRLALDAPPASVMQPDVVRRFFGFEAETVERDGRRWIVPAIGAAAR